MKEGYKKTELGWIPENWDFKLFGDIVNKIVGGGTPSRKVEKYFKGNIPWATVKDLDGNFYKSDAIEHITEEAIKNSATNLIEEGKIIIATRMGLGRGFINIVPMAINQDLKAIYPKYNVSNKFLMFWFLNCGSAIEAMGKGSTVKGITLEELKSFKVALPPLNEQQKIAEILSTVDSQIDDTDKLIEKTKELKEGLMQRILTKGIGHTEFKMTEIGEIPVEWEIVNLDDVVDIVNGGTPSTSIEEYWSEVEIPWATPTDITAGSKYINTTERYISREGLKYSSATLLPVNSILMTSRATIGEKSINIIPMATNQGFKSLICSIRIDNEFLYYYLDILKPYFISKSSGSTFLEISKKEVANTKVALPNTMEQKKIASILSSVDIQIEEYQNKKVKLERLKKALMQQLLTGKIRVVM